MRKLRITILVFLFAFIVACAKLNVYKTYGDNFRKDQEFNGIKQVMSNLTRKHLNILFIHGMGGYSKGDPDPIVEHIRKQYPHLKAIGGVKKIPLKHMGRIVGVLKIRKTVSVNRDQSITYYVLDWNEVTEDPKAIVKWNDKDIHYDTDDRLSVTKSIRSFMNHNIADVALYAGKYKEAMQKPIRLAIEYIGRNPKAISNVVITFSLGSTMLFDTLRKMNKKSAFSKSAAKRFRDNNQLLIMLANQIPIIHLSEIKPSTSIKGKNKSQLQITPSIKAIGSFVKATKTSNKGIVSLPHIIAISDPNDILSYPIFENLRSMYPNTFVTVFTSVYKTGFWLPKLGRFTHYGKAHTNYGIDKKVLNIIMNGSEASN